MKLISESSEEKENEKIWYSERIEEARDWCQEMSSKILEGKCTLKEISKWARDMENNFMSIALDAERDHNKNGKRK